jgi:hypothetical protein
MRCTSVVLTAVIATVRKGTPLFRYCAQNTRCQRTLLERGGWVDGTGVMGVVLSNISRGDIVGRVLGST